MSKAIVVEAKGKKVVGTVADESTVILASADEIDNIIVGGVDEIVAMLGGEMLDPTQKRCSRCVKMGRVPYHKIEDFSLLKNGKRHSQCKVCRTEQSAVWCEKRKDHRKVYHQKYHKGRPRRVVIPKGVKALMDMYNAEEAGATVNATDALFVGFPEALDLQETN